MAGMGRASAITAALVFVLAAVGCSPAGDARVIEASWADAHPTLDAMTESADAVALVSVTGVAGTGLISSDVDEVPYTDYTAEVSDPLGGDLRPDSITIRQTGGELDGDTYVVADDPMLEIGAEYVVFLTEYAPGEFRINGGPTGRLIVEGDQLTQLPESVLRADEVPADLTSLTAALDRLR